MSESKREEKGMKETQRGKYLDEADTTDLADFFLEVWNEVPWPKKVKIAGLWARFGLRPRCILDALHK